jgi:hypothetical protein
VDEAVERQVLVESGDDVIAVGVGVGADAVVSWFPLLATLW